MEILEIKTCQCGNETFFLKDGICLDCLEKKDREVLGEILNAYLVLYLNIELAIISVSYDLRKDLAEKLINEK
jgi:hypothetical protein